MLSQSLSSTRRIVCNHTFFKPPANLAYDSFGSVARQERGREREKGGRGEKCSLASCVCYWPALSVSHWGFVSYERIKTSSPFPRPALHCTTDRHIFILHLKPKNRLRFFAGGQAIQSDRGASRRESYEKRRPSEREETDREQRFGFSIFSHKFPI